LFVNVSEPDKDLEQLCEALGDKAYVPNSAPDIKWLNPEVKLGRRSKRVRKGKEHETIVKQSAIAEDTTVAPDDGGNTETPARAATASTQSNVRQLKR
jgi:hypothetical protein